MKVLINGAYSTGKTSLVDRCLRALRDEGRSALALDETARQCPFPLNRHQSFLGTQWLIHSQISREISASSEGSEFLIVDRGIPDIFAHYLETCARIGSQSPEIESLLGYLKGWCRTYDVVITTTVNENIDITPDGLRVPDKRYRDLMSRYNTEALSQLNRPAVILPFSTQADDRLLSEFIKELVAS